MFTDFKKAVQSKLDFLIENSTTLFQVEMDKEKFWNLYQDSFPEGTNEIYREKRKNDCNCCRSFMNHYGLIVGIVNGKMESIWDIETMHSYQVVANALSKEVKKHKISNVFLTSEIFGKDSNFDLNKANHPKYEHLHYVFPPQFVDTNAVSKQSKVRQTRDVIERGFKEINPSAVNTVLDLIDEKLIYRAEEFKPNLLAFKEVQVKWVKSKSKGLFVWESAVTKGRQLAIRNTAIGTLLVDISDGMEVEKACHSFGSKMEGYKRPKAFYTKKMKDEAVKRIQSLGLMDSLQRRYATLEDIEMEDILWASGESRKVIQNAFDLLADSNMSTKGIYSKLEEVGIDYFIENILPTARTLELMIENRHTSNFVSLITGKTPSLFQWNNPFSWHYNGGNTDSIRKAVEDAGGNVDGFLNCRLAWNEDGGNDNSDLDIWAEEPSGNKIGYSTEYRKDQGNRRTTMTGQLDVDNTNPNGKMAVENITWINPKKMKDGSYNFWVNQYSENRSKGFTVEIEFDGQIHTFAYPKPLRSKQYVKVATVTYKDGKLAIKGYFKSDQQSKEIWGVNTNQFTPVETVMMSPNYWGYNKGNKHHFFLLKGCVNTETARGFYNEFLKNELQQDRKVFEALGEKMKVGHSDNQLSGVGFSSTLSNSVVVKINSKPLKINFTDDKLILNSSKKKVQISNA